MATAAYMHFIGYQWKFLENCERTHWLIVNTYFLSSYDGLYLIRGCSSHSLCVRDWHNAHRQTWSSIAPNVRYVRIHLSTRLWTSPSAPSNDGFLWMWHSKTRLLISCMDWDKYFHCCCLFYSQNKCVHSTKNVHQSCSGNILLIGSSAWKDNCQLRHRANTGCTN